MADQNSFFDCTGDGGADTIPADVLEIAERARQAGTVEAIAHAILDAVRRSHEGRTAANTEGEEGFLAPVVMADMLLKLSAGTLNPSIAMLVKVLKTAIHHHRMRVAEGAENLAGERHCLALDVMESVLRRLLAGTMEPSLNQLRNALRTALHHRAMRVAGGGPGAAAAI